MTINEKELFTTEQPAEGRAALVGIINRESPEEVAERSLDELARLLDTAGGETVVRMLQAKETPDVRTYIGSGKVEELAELCKTNEIDLVVFDTELTPSQIRNLEDGLDGRRVIDRSMLILDIFALHAKTGEGKLQVELAQLKYTAPRLTGKGTELSRLGGGIGTRGPGESQLERDRRHLKRRIEALEDALDELERNRRTMRAARERSGIAKIAIVGYTNAGKSTLLNRLTDAGILAEDKLFATLDPTTRKFALPSGESVLLTDTVGFIRRLPHHLIKAFRSTLDEAVCADILLILLDASDPECSEQLVVTEQILRDLGAAGKPTLYVFNKCDREAAVPLRLPADCRDHVACRISAKTGEGVDELVAELERIVNAGRRRLTFLIPNAEAGALNQLYQNAVVESVDYGAEHITAVAVADAKTVGMLRRYLGEDYGQDETEDE
ncbi:MAG: GTPase HflX [Clostridia bacterium]|nr:GTPase HflX [Clostridia bacterium]